jgi:hypothetical protein
MAALVQAQTQKCKIITPGEHLGYELEYYNEKEKPVKTTIRQGETWVAVYVKDGYFSAKTEVLTWSTKEKENYVIASKGTQQPLFYVQGLHPLTQRGPCTTFKGYRLGELPPLKSWTHRDTLYAISYSRDRVTKKLAPYAYGKIQFDQPLVVFKGVDPTLVRQVKNQAQYKVQLSWTGDLNGDGEPDFLLSLPTHHETISVELVISEKTPQGVTWVRKARFTEWS